MIDYFDEDEKGYPLGIVSTITTGDATEVEFSFTLKHAPAKREDGVQQGDITNAGGTNDI